MRQLAVQVRTAFVQPLEKAGKDFAGFLRQLGFSLKDIARALWHGFTHDLAQIGLALYGAISNLPQVANALWNMGGNTHADVIKALADEIGGKYADMAVAIFSIPGTSLANVAYALSNGLGLNMSGVAGALWNGIGGSLTDVARALGDGIGGKYIDIARALFNGCGGVNLGNVARALMDAFGLDELTAWSIVNSI